LASGGLGLQVCITMPTFKEFVLEGLRKSGMEVVHGLTPSQKNFLLVFHAISWHKC
jgi:hypothetical protein